MSEAVAALDADLAKANAASQHFATALGQEYLSERLVVPTNITVVPLPAKCPELNSQENVWQFMRDNWLL